PYLVSLLAHPCRVAEPVIEGNPTQEIHPGVLLEKLPSVERCFRSLKSGKYRAIGKDGFGSNDKRSVISDLFRSKIQQQFSYTVVGHIVFFGVGVNVWLKDHRFKGLITFSIIVYQDIRDGYRNGYKYTCFYDSPPQNGFF